MDRIDIHMRVTRVEFQKLGGMLQAEVCKYYPLDESCLALMNIAMSELQLTARANHLLLKLSRTILDLIRSKVIRQVHLAEVLQYRSKVKLIKI